jgi:hypothetical protein
MNHSDNDDLQDASQWINYWNDIFSKNPDAEKNAELAFCPPEPSPEEQPAAEDPTFLASCRADVVSMSGGPVVWGDQLLTHSPKWGLIWRADFWNPKVPDQLHPSRITCWKNDDGELGTTVSGGQHAKLALKR